MNKDQVRGKWEELKGKVKKEYGEMTGDRKTQLKGAMQEGAGKVQRGAGDAIDHLDKTIKEGDE